MEKKMEQDPQPVEQPSLALSDLMLLLNLIRVTSERGAIKADELSAVGSVYDKLFKFLEASGAINKQASAEQPADQSV
jgi:hypothetical protein